MDEFARQADQLACQGAGHLQGAGLYGWMGQYTSGLAASGVLEGELPSD